MLWQAFVGVKARRVENYYQDLLSQNSNHSDNMKEEETDGKDSREESVGRSEKWKGKGQIEKDLPRTFPGHHALDEGGRNVLRRLLIAYAHHNASVGYCQCLAANVIMWKECHLSCGAIFVATAAWLLFKRSGLPFLTICSDVILLMVVWLFLRANYAVIRNRQLEELPELVLSEEMVNAAAASFCAKVNSILLMAHDITFGKDFRLFFQFVLVSGDSDSVISSKLRD